MRVFCNKINADLSTLVAAAEELHLSQLQNLLPGVLEERPSTWGVRVLLVEAVVLVLHPYTSENEANRVFRHQRIH